MIEFVIRECVNSACALRIPDNVKQEAFHYCPKCGSQMKIVSPYQISNDTLPTIPFKNSNQIILILDNIRSAYNVGSILRSAEGFQVDTTYLCGISPTPDNTKTKKTSINSEHYIRWEYCRNALHKAKELHDNGFILMALESGIGGKPLFEFRHSLTKKIALVFGNEVTGIDPELLNFCDEIFEIPMSGYKRSFNITIAVGITLFFMRYHI